MNRARLSLLLVFAIGLPILAWVARALLVERAAKYYFESHGLTSTVNIGHVGLTGVSGSFVLGPAATPEISADYIELRFDPLRWLPRVVEVRLIHPMVRVQIGADGKPNLGSLQRWIDSLEQQQGQSRFVSNDLTVSLKDLRLLVQMPGGLLEIDGDVRLLKSLPVSLTLTARPATIIYRGVTIAMRTGVVTQDTTHAVISARFSGAIKRGTTEARDVEALLDASGLTWRVVENRISVSASAARLQVRAASLSSTVPLTAPVLDLTARNIHAVSVNGRLDVAVDMIATAGVGLDSKLPALHASDPVLANALGQNLARLVMAAAGHVEQHGGATHFTLTAPLTITGAKGGVLRVSALDVSANSGALSASLDLSLLGSGLPATRLALRNLAISNGGFTADATLQARFNFAMLQGADIAAKGAVSWQGGHYAFMPDACARVMLAAFHPGASDLARNLDTLICAAPGTPLVTGEGDRWRLQGAARDASADLPLANVHADHVTALLAFDGEGGPRRGTASVTAGRVSDRTAGPRFLPLLGSGIATLADGVWRGHFKVTGPKNVPLGETTFTHAMTSGIGSAHIAAPYILFAADNLQPADLSPLLAALRRSEGAAAFAGDIHWTPNAIASQGRLSIAALDFLTPFGKAHAVKTDISLSSLLPPMTSPGQAITISRVDWTLPFSAVDVRFEFNPTAFHLDKADTDIAQGHASLGAMTINLADPGRIAGTVQVKGIALNALVTASNLGSKLKLDGKITGRVPFTLGPEGFRIAAGHIAAEGPGRLSVDRSLWMQGDAAISSNAVQDFAYQALENLAFDSMTAELNSVAGGRLQIVFHIKGRSDPPTPQVADIAIMDILNGTALYKPIPLPSGTPIDLTLDTSLNFDELLKSYAEAWSKTLSPVGAPAASGAKP